MGYKFNPLPREFDYFKASTAVLPGFDLSYFQDMTDVVYLDQGLRFERISSFKLTNTENSQELNCTVSWLTPSTMNQRIEKIVYSGSAIGSDVVEKVFNYSANGFKFRLEGYSYNLV